MFEGKQKIFEWILMESKNIWRKVKILEGKQSHFKIILTPQGHCKTNLKDKCWFEKPLCVFEVEWIFEI